MKVLVADDNQKMRNVLRTMLTRWGYDVITANDGHEAWKVLQEEDSLSVAVLDWVMPGMDGVTLCRELRKKDPARPLYILILTGRGEEKDVVEGLLGGADDYVTKPFSPEELQARIKVGVRMLKLQLALKERVRELEEAAVHITHLEGLLPICSYCKKIKDDHQNWHEIEMYVSEHAGAEFTHVVCPNCVEKILKPEMEEMKRRREKKTAVQ